MSEFVTVDYGLHTCNASDINHIMKKKEQFRLRHCSLVVLVNYLIGLLGCTHYLLQDTSLFFLDFSHLLVIFLNPLRL